MVSDSYGEFSEEFIAEVLEAERRCDMGLGKRFDNIDDALAYLMDEKRLDEIEKRDGKKG